MSGSFIDPLGPLALAAKYKKALEKGRIVGLRLTFTPAGVVAEGQKPPVGGQPGAWVALTEAMASTSGAPEERPFPEEKEHMCSKYELRLDEAAPESFRNAANKAALQAAVAALDFRKRRALLMSNKEFETAFLRWEDGNPIPRPAEEVDALRRERNAARGGNRGRGRGRGGRGQQAFRAPQNAAAGNAPAAGGPALAANAAQPQGP